MEKENILVVDDDKDIVATLKIQLQKEGYHVLCAYNGKEALNVLEQQTVHLILLDIMMPQMDGFSAIMRIRERLNIPILIMSAKSEESEDTGVIHRSRRLYNKTLPLQRGAGTDSKPAAALHEAGRYPYCLR